MELEPTKKRVKSRLIERDNAHNHIIGEKEDVRIIGAETHVQPSAKEER